MSSGWDGVSRVLQVSTNSVNQVDGVSDMAPACWLCGSVGGGFRKETIACLSLWKKVSPSSHLDARHFSSSLYAMPLVPFKLLPLCWSSEGVSLSKSVCGPVKSNCLGL